MKYVLNWNNEYMDMQIISGPSDEETAREEMKKAVIEFLIRFGIETDRETATARYLAAENAGVDEEEQELHVSSFGASIIYHGGYEDRYQIVDYGQDDGSLPQL